MKDQIIEYYRKLPTKVEVDEVVRSLCWIAPTIKEKTPEQKMLDKVNEVYLEKHLKRYFNESFDTINFEETLSLDGVDIQGGFSLDKKTWIDVQVASTEEWKQTLNEPKRGQPRIGPILNDNPGNLLRVSIAVLRGWIRGYSSDRVTILLVNRNNQYLKAVDIENIPPEFLEEAQMRLHGATSKEYGADMCAWCPVKKKCPQKRELVSPKTEFLKNSVHDLAITENIFIRGELTSYLTSLNNKPSPSHNDGWLHPSEMAITTCDRRLAYALKVADKREKIWSGLRMIFDVGHCVHDVLQEAMTDAGIPIEILAEDKEAKIHGRTDGAGENFIVEIKSAAHNSYKKFEKSGPSDAHIKQTSVYSTLLSKSQVRFLYFNKNDGSLMEIVTPHNRQVYEQVRGRALSVVDHVEAGTLPAQIDKKTECKQCPYMEVCKGEVL